MQVLQNFKSDKRWPLITAGVVISLCIICGVISMFTSKSAPAATVDTNAIYTSAVQTALASMMPPVATKPVSTSTPVSTATPAATDTPLPSATATLTLAQRIASYKPIDPRELITYPNKYLYDAVFVRGTVLTFLPAQILICKYMLMLHPMRFTLRWLTRSPAFIKAT